MALIDKASLLMVPSTYEAGKLYNVLPSGNRAPDSTDQNSGYDQTRADFDFDRGSNAAATRIGSDGLLKKYQENLLLQSNQFDTTWSVNVGASVTSGQSGYDGSNDAWLLSTSQAGSQLVQSKSASGVHTLSVYAKAGTYDFCRVLILSANTAFTDFNLASGTIGTQDADTIDSTITSVGDGWYRLTLTAADSAITAVRLYAIVADNDLTGTSGNILIQNAQLESGLVATEYLNSTSVTAKAGVLVDMPRINYDANGENGALLLEPSRANILPQSEYFNGSFSGSFETNAAISPDGTMNASKFVFTQGASYPQFYTFLSGLVVGQQYTSSIYIKKTEASEDFQMISSGVVFTPTDEWQRVITTFTATSTSQSVLVNYVVSVGVGVINEVYVAFAQVEANATYATSYIPNHSGTGGVTRAADSCSGGGSAESINSVEGVLYAEISALNNDGTYRSISLSDGSTNNELLLYYYANNILAVDFRVGAVNQAPFSVTVNQTAINKIAIKYKVNDFALWVNGTEVATDTSGSIPSANTFNNLSISRANLSLPFYGNVKQLAVFNEALSDSELATLTTL